MLSTSRQDVCWYVKLSLHVCRTGSPVGQSDRPVDLTQALNQSRARPVNQIRMNGEYVPIPDGRHITPGWVQQDESLLGEVILPGTDDNVRLGFEYKFFREDNALPGKIRRHA